MLSDLMNKKKKLVIGLMSGTSVDGIDAALVEITGYSVNTRVRQLAFITLPFASEVRQRILTVAGGEVGGSQELCLMNALLGQLSADACEAVCRQAGIPPTDVDLVGSHGQTIFHQPKALPYLGHMVNATLQVGEASFISERLSCPVVSDFRVRDMAAGGLGAPLVPYTEFLLYCDEARNTALQNIGGIGNVTLLPAGCSLEEVTAFDTGPGNMVMDALTARITNGKLAYDEDGRLAAKGKVDSRLLTLLLEDDYITLPPPKTTGREMYGVAYMEKLVVSSTSLGLSLTDTLATATYFTAECIRQALQRYSPFGWPHRLIVGGGGSQNPTLMRHIRSLLPRVEVLVNEDVGFDSNAKEAVAFAVLANEAVHGCANNAIGATGARHSVVMGKISQ